MLQLLPCLVGLEPSLPHNLPALSDLTTLRLTSYSTEIIAFAAGRPNMQSTAWPYPDRRFERTWTFRISALRIRHAVGEIQASTPRLRAFLYVVF